jgi:hypothetical protein
MIFSRTEPSDYYSPSPWGEGRDEGESFKRERPAIHKDMTACAGLEILSQINKP